MVQKQNLRKLGYTRGGKNVLTIKYLSKELMKGMLRKLQVMLSVWKFYVFFFFLLNLIDIYFYFYFFFLGITLSNIEW